jgi:HMG box factor
MVMSMPYLAKIKLLRHIATPIREPSSAPLNISVRGSIITVEGDDKDGVDSVLRHLADSLERSGEFVVRVMTGPKEPNGKIDLKEFLFEVASWHEKSTEMINFITKVGTELEGKENTSKTQSNVHKDTADADKMDVDETAQSGPDEGEIVEGARKDPNESGRRLRARELERNTEGRNQSIDRESERRRLSEHTEKVRKIPLLLISNYLLHASNAWACAVPIDDAYSPPDHWQWVATLWRGIVGADMTVYVKSADKEDRMSALSGENWASVRPTVDIIEGVGVLIVKTAKEGGIEEGAARRVAFEVGEWARATAANACKGA